ncbi:hypothetical protein CL6EHI_017690 [Entamoeba histolytica]|uniref:Uncharacterized protein n=2 Tax=Entamoeba histolytica TaxID=5759 RepID=C4M3F2_ENTH1|nr:hypothetical protein EHI_017690 [Entamoeba histolytica HM-1:IMSS]EAL45400.1 hypothetical protein EHI_017690 [Entamoeba histolytica HM-1:IMSS]BAN39395.1 hypothetical protein [Entamoeba histolytica]GAT95856.1 hypothetical protein CL6EHI_017690 [Entamoeba histolytica]|eukprot:XP_650786.1 hypothetical protein EHI_017690 [Entamoeba histolytica HM-1:IMSS]
MSKKGGRKNKKVTKLIIGEEEINNVDDLLTNYVEEKKGVKPKESSDIYVPNFANHQERPQRQPRAEGEKKEDDGLWTVRHGHDFRRRQPKKDREEDREPQPSEADTADSWRRKEGEAFVPRKGGEANERNQREPRQPAGPSEADTADSWRRKEGEAFVPRKAPTEFREHELREPRQPAGPSEADTADSWRRKEGEAFVPRKAPTEFREHEQREPRQPAGPSEADTADSWRRKEGEAFVPRKVSHEEHRHENNERQHKGFKEREPPQPSEADTADSWRRKDSDVPIPKKTYERRHENTEKPHRDFGERRTDDRGKRTFGPRDGQHQNTKKSTQHIKQGKKTPKQSSKPVVDEEGWMTQ